jgi:hypothetical protein
VKDRRCEIYEGDRDEEGRYHGKGKLFYVSDDPRCRDCYIGTYVSVCESVHARMCTHVCVRAYVHARMYASMCVCVCVRFPVT